MNTYHIRFSIQDWDPTEVPVIGEFATAVRMTKRLEGDLAGDSVGLFLNAGQQEGARTYLVCERLSGTTPDGERSSVVIEHGGIEDDDAETFGRIVPGSGTGAFAGRRGRVAFLSDDEGEYMELTVFA